MDREELDTMITALTLVEAEFNKYFEDTLNGMKISVVAEKEEQK